MTDIKYDPELPYVVEWQPGSVWARFHQESDALEYVEREGGTFVDTTPKPKIPEDVRYLLIHPIGYSYFAEKLVDGWLWHSTEEILDHDDLLEYIGDAEVTVLVRKEES